MANRCKKKKNPSTLLVFVYIMTVNSTPPVETLLLHLEATVSMVKYPQIFEEAEGA